MFKDGKVWMARNDAGEEICLLPGKANRHGLIAGATGTGKTVTLRVMAEAFSDMGVPVFLADVKGDLAGLMAPGVDSEDMQARIERFGLRENGFSYKGYPVTFWDIYGQNGIQLRTTISEMGPLLLSRIMKLNELQSNILSIVFKIADDNDLLLIDTKDLKAMLNHVNSNHKEYEAQYGKMSPASIAAILRAVVALEIDGGEVFFGEPGLNIYDLLTTEGGKGMINVLDSESLINNGRLYSTFLLWLLSELFEMLPEVGDPEKPKMVFFFDEAHLLFNDAPKSLLEKIEQVVKLVRSKGVGVYFCTQNPKDVPDGVLSQLGNKIQHALHAYTPADRKAVRAAADSFRENPDFDTFDTIMALGTGEAVISFLQEDGTPGIAQKAKVLPPQSRMGAVTEDERAQKIRSAVLYGKYAEPRDPESAYEILERLGIEREEAVRRAKEEAEEAKRRAKEEAEEAKRKEKEEAAAAKQREKEEREAQREAEKAAAAKKKAAKTVGSTVAGTVGREVGKTVGGTLGGTFGKTLGGNIGASLGRGIIGTLFRN
jgi:DNA helicase HerA-like ATPase